MRNIVFLLLLLILITPAAKPAEQDKLILPAGDAGRGREAFLLLRCNACHRVAGTDFPGPVASPPVPIVLGEAPSAYTDEKLVTAIINPSHSIARPELGATVATAQGSRMGDYTSVMTVRQLVDLVTFLREKARK